MTSVSQTSPPTALWATPSKEWVIQPRPKPGRKPKKDVSPAKDTQEADAKVRRVQNRAAQRAFRERKQSQLAELQARIHSYEQGEIERNVALQNVAKRLKDENEQLRRENQLLKEKLENIDKERQSAQDREKKRARDPSPSTPPDSALFPVKKKSKPDTDSPLSPSVFSHPPFSYIPSPPSVASTPESHSSSDAFSSLPYDSQPEASHSPFNTLMNFSTTSIKPVDIDTDTNTFVPFNCGFCNEDTPCVCREIALQHAADSVTLVTFKSEDYATERPIVDSCLLSEKPTAIAPSDSILENLPPYQPPVPLRRKPKTSTASIFPTQPAISTSSGKTATCSGDPSNCLACADDPFGKAFCSAIEKYMASHTTCSEFPKESLSQSKIAVDGTCCNSRLGCNHCSSLTETTQISARKETIPTNEAWRQIKAHPNVAFTDLSLLADVVVSRSNCPGPNLEVSQAAIDDPVNSTANASTYTPRPTAVFMADPHTCSEEKSYSASPPPQLVPEEVLIQCGRRRVREVYADAVRDALRLLDAKFS